MSGRCLRSTCSLSGHAHCSISSKTARGNSTTRKAEDPRRTSLRILVAEDEHISRLFITRALQKYGHSVKSVKNGQEALALLESDENFDALLTDIQMPLVDGVELTHILRHQEKYHHRTQLPIIAMTAYAISGDREKFLQAGMDDYIPKPINMQLLEKMFKNLSSQPQ